MVRSPDERVGTSLSPQAPISRPAADSRWRSRRWVARLIRLVAVLTPVCVSFGTALVLTGWLDQPSGAWMSIGRWVMIAVVSTVVLILVQAVTKRLLPLAALYSLSLIFPDDAPSRFGIALRSRTTRELRRDLDQRDEALPAATPRAAAEELLVLVAQLSKHDRLTRGHSERVRAYSRMLGEEIGLSDDELDRLHWAGLLHDIGKIGVSAEILNKPGLLTSEEFEEIKTHTVIGERLATGLHGWLGGATSAVWEHHEMYAGGGYPTGAPSAHLPLTSRIVCVADAFDVMTSARSYKQPISGTDARAELERCSGSQFDPQVVRAMMTISLGSLWRAMGPLSLIAQLQLFPRRLLQGGLAVTIVVAALMAMGFTGAAALLIDDPAETTMPEDAIARDGENPPPSSASNDEAPDTEPADTEPAGIPVPGPVSTESAPSVPTTATPSAVTTTSASTPTSTTITSPATTSVVTTVRSPSSPTTVRPRTTTPAPVGAPPTSNATTTTLPSDPNRLTLASPQVGDVFAQPVLPMLGRGPINGAPLPNYDYDRNEQPGLTLQRSSGDLDVTDVRAIQRWSWTLPAERTLAASEVQLWASGSGVTTTDDILVVRVGLYACDNAGSACALIADDETPFAATAATFRGIAFDLTPVGPVSLGAGQVIEVRVAVLNGSATDVILAYDSVEFPAQLTL